MRTVLLPPGVNPIAVNKYININISIKITGVLNCRQAARITSASARGGGTVETMYYRRASGSNARGAPGYHGTTSGDGQVAGVGIQKAGSAFKSLYPHQILFM